MTNLFITFAIALAIRLAIYKIATKNAKHMQNTQSMCSAVSLFRGDPFVMDAVLDPKIWRKIFLLGAIVGGFVVLFDYSSYLLGWAIGVLLVGWGIEWVLGNKKVFIFDGYAASLVVVLALPVIWITGIVMVLVGLAEQIMYLVSSNPEATIETITGPSSLGSAAAVVSALVLLGLVLYDIWHMFGFERPFSLFRFFVKVDKKELMLAKQVGNKEVIRIDLSKPYEYTEAYVYISILGPTYGRFVKRKVYVYAQNDVYLAFLFYPGLDDQNVDDSVPYFYHTDIYQSATYGHIVHPFDRKKYTEFENTLERTVQKISS